MRRVSRAHKSLGTELSQNASKKNSALWRTKNIGKFASVKTGRIAWYESLLERDYMYLLDFDPDVTYWHEQPLKIRYVRFNCSRTYREMTVC